MEMVPQGFMLGPVGVLVRNVRKHKVLHNLKQSYCYHPKTDYYTATPKAF